ncbi:MAG: hypothetical protein AAF662_11400, partial [Pseudomonadota bacterium]
MKTFKTTTFVSALALMAGTQAEAVVIADVAGDYIDASTLPANYSYLESDMLTGGTEQALDANTLIGNAGNTGWGGNADTDFRLSALLGSINGGAEFEIFGDGNANSPVVGEDLILHPAGNPAGGYVIVRRTITAGELAAFGTDATIAGDFTNFASGAGSSIGYVLKNGVTLFAGTAGTAVYAFDIDTTLAAGDNIDFVVWSQTTGNNSARNGDETTLTAT